MRRQMLFLALVLLFLATVNCAVPQMLWLVPVSTPIPKVRDFALWELFIDPTTLSPDCQIYEGPMPLTYEENAGAEEALFAWFHCYHFPDPPAGGMYAIYRFPNGQAAAKRYRRDLLGWFPRANRITPHVTPGWAQYQSSADQFHFACADFRGYTGLLSRECSAIGQYEEYISAFSFSVSPPERMADYTGFLVQMLQAIDERMADFLGKGAE